MATEHPLPRSRRLRFSPTRIIPSLTILGAGSAIVLSMLGVIQLTLPENIIIALLALLASDALTERLSILEKLEHNIKAISSQQSLRTRAQMIPVEEQAAHATDICIIAISGVSLSYRHIDFFERRIRSGSKIRIVLLNPQSSATQLWEIQSKVKAIAPDINSSLATFQQLLDIQRPKGKCEIRLSDIFPPFSMFAVDMNKDTGTMNVEFHLYKRQIGERPHIFLTPTSHSHWFQFYQQQFEQIWADSKPWIP